MASYMELCNIEKSPHWPHLVRSDATFKHNVLGFSDHCVGIHHKSPDQLLNLQTPSDSTEWKTNGMYSTSESIIFPLQLTVQQMRTVHHEVSRLASLEYSNVFTLEEV